MKPNPYAFPSDSVVQRAPQMGMTLRDYFAAAALNAVAMNFYGNPDRAAEMATHSYAIADAMLIERQKGQ